MTSPPFDFDSLDEGSLRARKTWKWNSYPADVLAMELAEMDFPTAPAVIEAIGESVRAESFGYPMFGDPTLAVATASWCERRYGWSLDPRCIHDLPDVLKGVELALEQFSHAGQAVIIPTPAYPPFFDVVRRGGREAIEIPMLDVAGTYVLDIERIGAAFAGGAGSIVLCNPHNPTGRAFTATELAALSRVVEHHGVRVIADEIHAPLVFGRPHVPYASTSQTAARHSVTLLAASKAWNLAGLKCAQVVLTNPLDNERWRALDLLATMGASTVGIAASIAAYDGGGAWLDAAMGYLERNRRQLRDAVECELPGARLVYPESTYLAWIDFSALALDQEPFDYFIAHSRVALKRGRSFGAGYEHHARINFATTSDLLGRAITAMAGALPGQSH